MAPALTLLALATLFFTESFEPGWEYRWSARELRGGRDDAEVVRDADETVLRLDSTGSATAYFRELGDGRTPAGVLSFRWKVASPLQGGADERTRGGDDYAARVFVVFDPLPLGRSTRAICYVWAAREPVGSIFRSPYSSRVATVVLQSGPARAGSWVSESRNVLEDYERYFGELPERVTAVAIMADTDDTGGRATAWFDDIALE